MGRLSKTRTEQREFFEDMAFKLGNALVLMSMAENRMSHGIRRGQSALLQPGIKNQQHARKLVDEVQTVLAGLSAGEQDGAVVIKLQKFTHSPRADLVRGKG